MGESPGKMYALAIFLTLLATTATVLRYYARYLKKNGYSWDDFLIFLALVRTILWRGKSHPPVVRNLTYILGVYLCNRSAHDRGRCRWRLGKAYNLR